MRWLVVALVLGLAGCRSCRSASTEAAADAAAAMPDVHVTVERPGAAPFVIDGPLLAQHPPEVRELHWLGWRLRTLVPNWNDAAPVDVIDEEGYRSPLLRPGEAPGELAAFLLMGLDSETRVVRVKPGKPLTAHRGEARKDAGRIRHAAKLVFLDSADAAVAGPAVALKVVVAGKETTWTRAELSKVPPIVLQSKDGDGERDAWPLRALATELVGANAMPSELLGEEPSSMKIERQRWNDPAVVPVIRANRRGRLKLVWLDAKTREEDDDEPQLRGVKEIRF